MGRSGKPTVSVVMPAYNAERFVGQAVQSILEQTLDDLELIVVDDGSSDRTPAILRRFRDPRLRVVSEPHRGVIAASNCGLELASGELISRFDADNVSEPDRLAVHAAMLASDPDLVIVGSASSLINEDGRVIGAKGRPTTDTGIRWRALYLMPGVGTFTCRAATVREHGVRYRVAVVEDHGFWVDMLRLGRAANSPKALYRLRVHPGQFSARNFDRQNRAAEQLAVDSLAELGLDVALDDIPPLRTLYLEPPQPRPASFLHHFETQLRAADALAAQPGTDQDEIEAIKLGVIAKLLVAYRKDARLFARALGVALSNDARGTARLLLRRRT